MDLDWGWHHFRNIVIIAVVVGPADRFALWAIGRFLAIEVNRKREAAYVAAIIGLVAGFGLDQNLTTGLQVSLLLLAAGFVLLIVNHLLGEDTPSG